MSALNYNKPVYLIVHGQHDLIGVIMQKLVTLGFTKDNLIQASPQKTGNIGDYVAMAWPPMSANEMIIKEITGIDQGEIKEDVMGAWSNVNQKEISRIPLS